MRCKKHVLLSKYLFFHNTKKEQTKKIVHSEEYEYSIELICTLWFHIVIRCSRRSLIPLVMLHYLDADDNKTGVTQRRHSAEHWRTRYIPSCIYIYRRASNMEAIAIERQILCMDVVIKNTLTEQLT